MNSDRSHSSSPESGASSSRSDWFRQSVLFWSSQSERSEEPNNFTEDNTFVSSKPRVENSSRCESPSTGCNEYSGNSGDSESARNVLEEFDASDLLKQVDELERCFKKSRTEVIISEGATSEKSSSAASPHLTLEFPKGSSIRENPIFKGDLLLRKQNSRATSVNESMIEEDEALVVQHSSEQNKSAEKEITKQIDKGEEDEKDILESIQKVQTTLCEISREIELSSACSRLSNLCCSDEDDDNIIEMSDIESRMEDASGEQCDVNEGRDPNLVMRDWLSNIKPPPPQPQPQTGTQLSVDNVARHEVGLDSETTVEIPVIVSSESRPPTREELFKKIDELMDFHRDDDDDAENKTMLSYRSNSVKSSNRDRLDSGLQSVSSDSSPYPSPNVTRSLHQQQRNYSATKSKPNTAIRGKLHEGTDQVFRDDSDFSDWSPISTLEIHRGDEVVSTSTKRTRSQSLSCSPRTRGELSHDNSNNMNNVPNGSHEAATIEKFLQLTNKYLDKDGASTMNSTINIDDVSVL